jgi:hypothetical protein
MQCLLAEAPLQPVSELLASLRDAIQAPNRSCRPEDLDEMELGLTVLAARLGLDTSVEEWEEGIGSSWMMTGSSVARWLPSMLRHSDAAAARLVCCMPGRDRRRLRTLALCLRRAQHQYQLSAPLPASCVPPAASNCGAACAVAPRLPLPLGQLVCFCIPRGRAPCGLPAIHSHPRFLQPPRSWPQQPAACSACTRAACPRRSVLRSTSFPSAFFSVSCSTSCPFLSSCSSCSRSPRCPTGLRPASLAEHCLLGCNAAFCAPYPGPCCHDSVT